MRRRLLLLVLALSPIAGCHSSSEPTPQSAPRHIRMLVSRYEGVHCAEVPLGKCVVAPSQATLTIPSPLALLKQALSAQQEITDQDDVWVYVTPKRQLTVLDFVQSNEHSGVKNGTIHLSFDFIQYDGDVGDLPSPMSCVLAFHIGRLDEGRYKLSVMNSYLHYLQMGKESEATPVPKHAIHPDIFWHQLEFPVKKGKGIR